ncbi:hypothetical protein G210_0771 [Candida maltosa Xu316]|uniref:DUF833-domain-containing protein n=1 Tax=Candida maltosa (strain Xu316) TaxID=1245528 RepID=M3J954_CANMX|nr:hypothetical protein G210_0771 [Candida maltosa Xu316]
MCIALATTNHPDYPFILLSNRDEFFKRPTMPATFKDIGSDTKLLAPLDLARQEHGTWIGVTTDGKIAVLVNYRENDEHAISEVSRGILPLDYLCGQESDEEWKNNLASAFRQGRATIDLKRIGGFSLMYGKLSINPSTGKIHHLNILSNRGDQGKVFKTDMLENGLEGDSDDIPHKTTFGLSNSLYNKPWDKVKLGEALLSELIDKSLAENYSQDKLVDECFKVLSHNTYPQDIADGTDFDKKFDMLKYSIFIPPLVRHNYTMTDCISVGKYYGTRTQTIILLDKHGNLNYYERNIHNSDDLDEKLVDITSHYKFNVFHDFKNGC